MKKKTFLLLLGCLLFIGLAGCSKGPATDTSITSPLKSELIIGYEKDTETLDTFKTSWFSDSLIYVYDRLISRDYDFDYKPSLATRWKTSEDGMVWTFYLKDGVTFHDGTPLSSADVAWTLNRIIDPEIAAPIAADYSSIREVIAKDPLTVEVHLNHPYANLPFVLSSTSAGIVSEKSYTEKGDTYGISALNGTGPFKFVEWKQGDRIVLEKNDAYEWGPDWMENGGKPQIDRIVMRIIPEENTRMMEIEAGNVHVLRDVPATFKDQLSKNENIKLFSGDATKLVYLAYATDKTPFNDIKVRKAINHAINRAEIVDYLMRKAATVADGYLPPALKSEYFADSSALSYDYDPESSKALLKEAGFPEGFTTTLAAENTSQFTKLAETLQHQLKEVGIDAKINMYDTASYADMLKSGKQDMFIRLYSWPNADILDYLLLSSQFPYPNHSRWNDSTTDDLIKSAASSSTWEERSKGYHKVQKHLIEQAVWAPIYIPEMTIAVRNEVKNFKFHPWIPQFNDNLTLE